MTPQEAFNHIEEATKERDRLAYELATINATLIINYGPNGRQVPGIVKANETETIQLFKVLEYYVDEVERLRELADRAIKELEIAEANSYHNEIMERSGHKPYKTGN